MTFSMIMGYEVYPFKTESQVKKGKIDFKGKFSENAKSFITYCCEVDDTKRHSAK